MIAVIFEFTPAPGRRDEYMELAAGLWPDVEKLDGFISIERFQSVTSPERMVSISYWRDEEALARWRNFARHREAQGRGRGGVFSDYRLRVAQVMRDYTHEARGEAPADSRALDDAARKPG